MDTCPVTGCTVAIAASTSAVRSAIPSSSACIMSALPSASARPSHAPRALPVPVRAAKADKGGHKGQAPVDRGAVEGGHLGEVG